MAEQSPAPGGWEAPTDLSVGPAPGVKFAGPGARLIAYLVDSIIQACVFFVLFVVLSLVLVGAVSTDSGAIKGTAIVASLLAVLGFFLFALVYFPWFWSRGGQTPGMKLTHVKVVRDLDGGPVSVGSAVLRLVGYWINQIAFYIGFLWIFVDKRHRGWHDLIAGTCVIEA